MDQKFITPRTLTIIAIILLAAAARFMPHPPNFTPITAIALFGGAFLGRKVLAFLIPLAAMFVSDLLIGFHGTMYAVYISFIMIAAIGLLLRSKAKPVPVLIATVSSSLLFFLVTNFAVWIGSPFYPQNFAGLIECYVAAIPFFNNGILGDLFFSTLMFGGFYLIGLRFPALSEKRVG